MCGSERELLIALPESFPELYDPDQLLTVRLSERIVKRYGFDTVQQFYNAIKIAQDATYKYQMDVATWGENTTKSNL